MATMVTSTKTITKKTTGGGSKFPGPNGNGSKRNGNEYREPDRDANRYRIGMWVALASIAMMFTALSSAYIVRAGSSNDWQALSMPRLLILSTGLILVSSAAIETARRKLKATLSSEYSRWLLITAALGLAFLVSQFLAWRQLVRQGIYVSSNPHSSFFYLLTATHAVHLFGGLLALSFLWFRSRRPVHTKIETAKRQAGADAVTIYWHFMDALWIYLFLLLFLWR